MTKPQLESIESLDRDLRAIATCNRDVVEVARDDLRNTLRALDEIKSEISSAISAVEQFRSELSTMPNITVSTPESKLLHEAILARFEQLFRPHNTHFIAIVSTQHAHVKNRNL